MSTDRDLIAAAAKAAGYNFQWEPALLNEWPEPTVFTPEGFGQYWNPLEDDGDALRLAVNLKIDVTQYDDHVVAWFDGGLIGTGRIEHGDDPYAAARRCIVLAAASMAPQEKAE